MGLTFFWSSRLFANRYLSGFIRHDVVNRQFDYVCLTRLVLTTPITLVLVLLLWTVATNAHDLHILKEFAVSTIRI
jgi:hypothetical protein